MISAGTSMSPRMSLTTLKPEALACTAGCFNAWDVDTPGTEPTKPSEKITVYL